MTVARHRNHNWKIGFQKQNERSVIERTKPRAQGIEARQGQDGNRLDPKDESPVRKDAPHV